jgi:dTDP-4-amino-4,6-dideoxygalactose transaminase
MPFSERTGTGHLCVVCLDDPALRDSLRHELTGHGIQTSLHYPPIHLFAHYRETFGTGPGDFPVAESLAASSVTLPLYPGIASSQVDEVCERIAGFLAGRRRAGSTH